MTFTPDPVLWRRHHYRLRYLDDLAVAQLKRAAIKYYEFSPDGRPDLYGWKVIQCEVLTDQALWMIFCDFYFSGNLHQLRDWL